MLAIGNDRRQFWRNRLQLDLMKIHVAKAYAFSFIMRQQNSEICIFDICNFSISAKNWHSMNILIWNAVAGGVDTPKNSEFIFCPPK